MFKIKDQKIGILGLGYVGLPLFIEFAKFTEVVGFDTNKIRINELQNFNDINLDISHLELQQIGASKFSSNSEALSDCNVFIITVPTPIDVNARPNLKPLIAASKTVSKFLKTNDVVIYESTVYPGATEEVCIPELENISGLKFNKDFFVGYSPERINPGDKTKKLKDIEKIVSGSNVKTSEFVQQLYEKIIDAGTFMAKDIKTAEAAKVIENIQRDVNIALVNEFALIFNKMGIDSNEVLSAASTKWNFIPFSPGLVGGHCIGVDPYYLKHKSELLGIYPKIISASRETNESMPAYIASQILSNMNREEINISSAKILVLGLTFKENCPDIRNSKVFKLIDELKNLSLKVTGHDPYIVPDKIKNEYDLDVISSLAGTKWDVIVIAVKHEEYVEMSANELKSLTNTKNVIYDIKCARALSEGCIRL